VELTGVLRGFDFAWARVGAGPGHAIQLRSGRLLVPVWLNDRIKGNYRSAVVYSDDGGANWKTGGIVPPIAATDANECMLFERRDGAVVVSLRSSVHQRHTAVSRNAGLTWSEPAPVDGVPDAVCQASILALAKGRVMFANSASDRRRVNLTLRLSQDDGATWPVSRVLYEGPSGYSDLAAGKDGAVYCLFEYGTNGSAGKIGFAKIPRGWFRP
jgi:sialidase-1